MVQDIFISNLSRFLIHNPPPFSIRMLWILMWEWTHSQQHNQMQHHMSRCNETAPQQETTKQNFNTQNLVRQNKGRTVAQAVSRRLPTAATRGQVRSCGICGGQSGAGVGFHQRLHFPLPFIIPPNSPSL
jgi:hypothetical protein